MVYDIKRVSSVEELTGVLALHQENYFKNISKEESLAEGFVTAEYDGKSLQLMHTLCPSVIAKDGEEVVGYVLAVTKEFYGHNKLLDQLFDSIDKLNFEGQALVDQNYILCGQLCVKKGHRGQGIARKMYEYYRDEMHNQYPYCITDVASSNPRSVKAHSKTGFQVIDSTSYDGVKFDIILWDWSKK